MLDVTNLNFAYGNKHILKNIKFKLNQGDFLAIVGHNGSGKSTLIKCLLGENKVSNHQIKVNDIDINNFKNWKQVGYLSQNLLSFTFHFPIKVSELLSAYNKNKNEYSTELLKVLNIENLLDDNVNNLSGGQLQRVFIAKTLINDPKIIIFDEPVDGMDQNSIHFFYDYLGKLKAKGKTIIVVTHNLETCAKSVTHVLSLGGKSYNFCTKDEYFNNTNDCTYCGDSI